MDPRTRLVAFYAHYAPEKVGNVDKALQIYAGREEQMFETLVEKYGPEPIIVDDGDGEEEHQEQQQLSSEHNNNQQQQPSSSLLQETNNNNNWPMDYKSRLVRFYQAHCPEKLENVDKALEVYKGREEDMFQFLCHKYQVPEPHQQQEIQNQNQQQQSSELEKEKQQQLPPLPTTNYHQQQEQQQQPSSTTIAKQQEEEQNENPTTRTAVEEVTSPQNTIENETTDSSDSSYRSRLERFYAKYNPEKLSVVDRALVSFKGREEEMFANLVEKYGPEPTTTTEKIVEESNNIIATPVENTTKNEQISENQNQQQQESDNSNSSPNSYRERLVRFYSKYNPEKVPLVDRALATFEGREDEMFVNLVEKYGPEPDADQQQKSDNQEEGNNQPEQDSKEEQDTKQEQQQENPPPAIIIENENEQEIKQQEQNEKNEKDTEKEKQDDEEVAKQQQAYFNYRSRLIAFYMKYAPEKLSKVPSALETWEGKEEEMFQHLVEKYGPEPRSSSTMTTSSSNNNNADADQEENNNATNRNQQVQEQSSSFSYNQQQQLQSDESIAVPQKAMLPGKNDQGEEISTTSNLNQKPVLLWSSDPKSRLIRFYQQYAPDKIDTIDTILDLYRGREEQIFDLLVSRYGPEPEKPQGDENTIVISHPDELVQLQHQQQQQQQEQVEQEQKEEEEKNNNTTEEEQQDEGNNNSQEEEQKNQEPLPREEILRRRLVRFYEQYNPAKLCQIEKTVEEFLDMQNVLFKALTDRYGPEPEDDDDYLFTAPRNLYEAVQRERKAMKAQLQQELKEREEAERKKFLELKKKNQHTFVETSIGPSYVTRETMDNWSTGLQRNSLQCIKTNTEKFLSNKREENSSTMLKSCSLLLLSKRNKTSSQMNLFLVGRLKKCLLLEEMDLLFPWLSFNNNKKIIPIIILLVIIILFHHQMKKIVNNIINNRKEPNLPLS